MGNKVKKNMTVNFLYLSCIRYPPDQHPVIALKGAPAKFPVRKEHRHLQQYLKWSKRKLDEAQEYINNTIGDNPYLAIHLRMGIDWVRTKTETVILELIVFFFFCCRNEPVKLQLVEKISWNLISV